MFVRIVPAADFANRPTLPHRPYAFYADSYSLHGRTIAECYTLVRGGGLPRRVAWEREVRSPFVNNDDFAPHSQLPEHDHRPDLRGGEYPPNAWVRGEDSPADMLDVSFVLMTVGVKDAEEQLDPFPATWRSISYIVSDGARMGAHDPLPHVQTSDNTSARVHTQFRAIHRSTGRAMLAEEWTKHELGLTDLVHIPTPSEEAPYYSYVAHDSAFTNEIVDLFGIDNRCWHGCGYIGWPGFPLCRIFLLKNVLGECVRTQIVKGSERFRSDAD